MPSPNQIRYGIAVSKKKPLATVSPLKQSDSENPLSYNVFVIKGIVSLDVRRGN